MTSADQAEWVPVFTSLSVRQFRKLVRIVVHRGGEQSGTGRRWSLPFADRVLLFTEYYRTNLTLRSVALQFGVSKSGAHGWWTTWHRCAPWLRSSIGMARTRC
ncbi:helix-turn-helix domain-containing protein [Spirillospora sp. NBC_01491]|uniref:helix-turn-helix domain-containing protein n=1 Tax=Spirillospora sp. NBC_01491 TaxID=2976007 RepID=UPI002E36F0F2|nr:transposase family protein [Spirillospora sp. NBC_01491]